MNMNSEYVFSRCESMIRGLNEEDKNGRYKIASYYKNYSIITRGGEKIYEGSIYVLYHFLRGYMKRGKV